MRNMRPTLCRCPTQDALSQALSALLNRAMAIAATTSLLPAPRAGSLAELLQPPKYHPSGLRGKPPPSIGALLGLCVEESLVANDLVQWVTDMVAGQQLRGRLPLAPGPSYVLWRTIMVVLRDKQAGRCGGCLEAVRPFGMSLPPFATVQGYGPVQTEHTSGRRCFVVPQGPSCTTWVEHA